MHDTVPRRRRLGIAAATIGLTLGLTLLASPAFAAPGAASVTIAAPATAAVGDTVDVTVTIHGASDVFGYQVAVGFDPAVFSYVAGSETGPAGGFDSSSTGTGTVTLVDTRLGTSPSLSGDLDATLKLKVLSAGSTALTVDSVELVDTQTATTTVTTAGVSATVVTSGPAGSGGSGGSGSGAGSSGSTGTAASASGPLASTGQDIPIAAITGIGVGAIALGAVIVLLLLRRRALARTR